MNLLRLLAQNPPPLPDTVNIYTTDPAYAFINNARPSMYVTSAITILLGLSGVASFLYLLWGGLQWIMAGGDKDLVDKARKKIVGALIGLSATFSAYALLYIVRVLFNVNLIGFNLYRLGS